MQEHAVLYIAAFWAHTLWTPGGSRRSPLPTTGREFSFPFFPNCFTRQTRGALQRLTYYRTRCVHCGLWSAELWVGFCKDSRLSPHRSSPSSRTVWRARGVPWRKPGKGFGGLLDFRIVSGTDCLKSKKIFFPAEDSPQGREFPVPFIWRRITQSYSMFTGNVTETTFTSITASLSKSYFTFGWIYFSVKIKGEKKNRRTALRKKKVVASFSRETVQTWRPWNVRIGLKSLSTKKQKNKTEKRDESWKRFSL